MLACVYVYVYVCVYKYVLCVWVCISLFVHMICSFALNKYYIVRGVLVAYSFPSKPIA